jgi:type IV pilus assembly protein PilV
MTNLNKRLNRGFTLLEVLVAVLVLSFGLLGIAGLLLATVQNNNVASQRTTATFLAQDMADRIRQNINATKKFGTDGVTAQTVYYLSSSPTSATDCYGDSPSTNCATRQGVASRDLYLWQQQTAQSLPGGSAIVCKDLTPDDGLSSATGKNGCDADTSESPWVIKIFWVVRAEDQVDTATTSSTSNVQRLSLMLGGT